MASNERTVIEGVAELDPVATLELLTDGYTQGAACAILTPRIKARLAEMAPGQVLLVRADDPSASLDVPAWCALTGHILEATAQDDNGVLSFYIRKKGRDGQNG